MGDLDSELDALLLEHDIVVRPFSDDAFAELPIDTAGPTAIGVID